jgi:anti-sigma B factor antagonist
MTSEHTAPPILVIRGEGHLAGDLELHRLDADGSQHLIVRRECPRDGEDLQGLVEEAEAAGTSFQDIIVDLERVTWLNSTGLGWLVGLVRQRKEHGDRVALAGVGERVASVLRATALELVLPRHDSVAAAAAALRTFDSS